MNKSKTADAIGTILQFIEQAGGAVKRRLDCLLPETPVLPESGFPGFQFTISGPPSVTFGNHMHVKMEYGLSCCQSVVLYQVEAVTL